MPPRPLPRLIRRLAGACFALMALAAFAPGRADAAGCGHGHRPTGGGSHLSSRLELLGGLTGEAAPDESTLPRPCSGPSCSEGHGVPLAPPTATIPRIESWAGLDPDALAARPLTIDAVASTDDPRPIHRGDTLFHPPRPA